MFRLLTIGYVAVGEMAVACAPAVRRTGGWPSVAQAAGPAANGYVKPATDSRRTVVKRDTGRLQHHEKIAEGLERR